MKPVAAAFLAGLGAGVVGCLLGGAAGDALFRRPGRPASKEPPKANAPATPSAHADGAAAPGAAPRLEGAAQDLAQIESARGRDTAAAGRGLAALATFHAVAGNDEEFLKVAEHALKSGSTLDDLLAALGEFPQPRRAALLATLLDRVPGATFEPVVVARILAEGEQRERALKIVRDALPQRDSVDPGLARLLLRLDPDGGNALLLDVAARGGWDDQDIGVVRALLVEAGHEDRLVPYLEHGLEKRPADRDLLRWLKGVDPVAAQARLKGLLASNAEDPYLWSLLGEIRRDAGDPGQAFDAFRRAAERRPSRSTFRDLVRTDPVRGLEVVLALAKDSQDDETIGSLAEMYVIAGRTDDAVREYLRAMDHDPTDREWVDRLTEIDPAAAAAALERRIAANPGAASDALVGDYGHALESAGRKDEAFEQYAAAFRKRPDKGEWQEALARADPKRALPILEAHVRDRPGEPDGHGALGLSLAALGRPGDATPHLEQALARGDVDRWYPAFRGVNPQRALEVLWFRASSEPMNAGLWGLLGKELHANRRDADARAALERAAALDPERREWATALRDLR